MIRPLNPMCEKNIRIYRVFRNNYFPRMSSILPTLPRQHGQSVRVTVHSNNNEKQHLLQRYVEGWVLQFIEQKRRSFFLEHPVLVPLAATHPSTGNISDSILVLDGIHHHTQRICCPGLIHQLSFVFGCVLCAVLHTGFPIRKSHSIKYIESMFFFI